MIRSDWHDRLLALGFQYVELYAQDKFSLEMLVRLPSVRHTVVWLYQMRVSKKKIEPIESLPDETKKELWALCRPYTTVLNRDECVEFVKCYWLLAQLAEMKS